MSRKRLFAQRAVRVLELFHANRRGTGSNCSGDGFPPVRGLHGREFFRASPGHHAPCDRPAFQSATDTHAPKRPVPTTSRQTRCTNSAATPSATPGGSGGSFFSSSSMMSILIPSAQYFTVGPETGFGPWPVAECAVQPVEQRENHRRRHRTAGRHHKPLPEGTYRPSSGALPPVSMSKTTSTGTMALATVPRTICAADSSRRIKSRRKKMTKPTANNGKYRRQADRRKASRSTAHQNGQSGDSGETRVQCRIDHEHRGANPPARPNRWRRPGKAASPNTDR